MGDPNQRFELAGSSTCSHDINCRPFTTIASTRWVAVDGATTPLLSGSAWRSAKIGHHCKDPKTRKQEPMLFRISKGLRDRCCYVLILTLPARLHSRR